MSSLYLHKGLEGKVAIVTGASSGIGEATAHAFGLCGAKVVLAARRKERLESAAHEIRKAGGWALVVPTDLTRQEDITHLVQTVVQELGCIDILANIAGWGNYDWFEEFDPYELRNQFEVNVLGLAELTRQVIPYMKKKGYGHIINMSSYASRIAVPPLTVYASTKYAIEGLSDGLRRELRPWGIYVSRVHPSAVTGTEFNQKAKSGGGIQYKSVPIGRISREKLAQVLVKLVENPKREVFISRVYDVPAFINRRFPGLVDLFFDFWVRRKRPELKEHSKALSNKTIASAGLLGLGVTAALIAWGLKIWGHRG
jgi:short-subunit dehydrogenase